MAHDIFISYSSKDKAIADAVCARLETRGLRCWIAPRDVQPGANYGASIIDGIHGSRAMVLVLSSNANASPHIPNEIERAVSRGVAVLPFRIEDVLPAKSLDLFIGSVHWLDALTPPLDRHLDHLAESLKRLLPDLPLAPPPVPPPPPPPQPVSRPVNLVKGAAAAVVVLGLAVGGWFALGRGGSDPSRGVPRDSAAAAVLVPSEQPAPAPAPAPAPPRGAAPAASGSGATVSQIVGCWRWSNNAAITIRADGTMTAGPFTGQWRRGSSGRRYFFTWPEPVDTLALSPDGSRLTGGNQYGVPVVATRVSGGPDFPGLWSWGGVATVAIDPRGAATLGTLSGSWVLTDPSQRVYRVTWPKIQDTVTLSADSTRIQGSNQYGAAVSGVRLPGCG